MSTHTPSPYVFGVRDIMHQPGQMREFEREFAVPEQLGAGVIAVPEGEPMRLEVRLESVHEGILASAEVSSVARGECVRCLTEVDLPVEVDFQELFAYSLEDAFDFEVHDERVDLEGPLRDAVVLSLPFQPVCRPDCPGLDPVTGERLADRPAGEAQRAIDPRWAALNGLADGDGRDDRGERPSGESATDLSSER